MPKHQADLEKWEDERIALCWKNHSAQVGFLLRIIQRLQAALRNEKWTSK